MTGFTLHRGFAPEERERIALLYWQAFGGKLGRVMGPEPLALAFFARVARPDHAISARDGAGALLGVAGFRSPRGAFVGGGWPDLVAIYGRGGALWRAALLSVLERDTDNERFLMDGICVAPEARGRGIGTALIEAICEEARACGYDRVRLDVVNENIRARALYERRGFVACGTARSGITAAAFGFASATTMVRQL